MVVFIPIEVNKKLSLIWSKQSYPGVTPKMNKNILNGSKIKFSSAINF